MLLLPPSLPPSLPHPLTLIHRVLLACSCIARAPRLFAAHARLQQTCRDCLELTGATPEPGITSDALARQLQLRWLQLIKAAEAMAAKGKGYKAQAKYEAERAEKAIAAGRELQAQLHAARQRIAELEAAAAQARGGTGDAGGASEGVGGSAGDDDGLSAFVASPCSASVPGDALLGGELSPLLAVTPSQPLDDGGNGHVQQGEGGAGGGGRTGSLVASTPAFLHEAEFDLKMQLSSPEMLAAAAEDMPAAARAGTSGSAGTTPREANLLGPSLSVRIVPVAGDRVQLSLE
jgi:hypothetical protein